MDLLKFTSSDLTYNRKGQLSPQQETFTNQQRRRTKRIVLIIGIVLLALAAGWSVAFLGQEELSARIVAVSVGLILFGLTGLFAVYLGVRPMPKIVLETIKGKVKVARVEHTMTSGKSQSKYVRTEIHVGGKILPLPDEAFSEVEDDQEYAVYIWKGTDHIFSLERL
jgi:hypothetical protein